MAATVALPGICSKIRSVFSQGNRFKSFFTTEYTEDTEKGVFSAKYHTYICYTTCRNDRSGRFPYTLVTDLERNVSCYELELSHSKKVMGIPRTSWAEVSGDTSVAPTIRLDFWFRRTNLELLL